MTYTVGEIAKKLKTPIVFPDSLCYNKAVLCYFLHI
jgi:hypothetical protein